MEKLLCGIDLGGSELLAGIGIGVAGPIIFLSISTGVGSGNIIERKRLGKCRSPERNTH